MKKMVSFVAAQTPNVAALVDWAVRWRSPRCNTVMAQPFKWAYGSEPLRHYSYGPPRGPTSPALRATCQQVPRGRLHAERGRSATRRAPTTTGRSASARTVASPPSATTPPTPPALPSPRGTGRPATHRRRRTSSPPRPRHRRGAKVRTYMHDPDRSNPPIRL
jgi:hypothetical protein